MSEEHQHGDGCTCGCKKPLLSREALELLEKHHEFPGLYMFKAIGFADGDFMGRAVAAAEAVLGSLESGLVKGRPSSGNKYLAVTLEVEVADANQVLAVYAQLKELEGLVALV